MPYIVEHLDYYSNNKYSIAKLTLINTIYALETVIICVTRLSPSKIILLSEVGADKKKKRSEDIIEHIL